MWKHWEEIYGEIVHSAKEDQRKAQSIPISIIFAARTKFEVSTYAQMQNYMTQYIPRVTSLCLHK